MYEYNLLWRHNCEYLYSEERTTGGFLRMATDKPPCVMISATSYNYHLESKHIITQHHKSLHNSFNYVSDESYCQSHDIYHYTVFAVSKFMYALEQSFTMPTYKQLMKIILT